MKLTIEIPDADEEQFRHCFRQWQQTGAVLYASICRGILDRCKQIYHPDGSGLPDRARRKTVAKHLRTFL